ncbi:hypothetical protein RvY_08670-2 [Ramazzottius varieornatus]|uniref:Uncharacterized protein n=1 Tax=Ramazzottius varieornatus TaxID=947166 RepID=A0A1D1V6R6_RAMVA|nr:hypothetical protein RvY_08670-2 [Ramazzottius varieornatus]
MEPVLIPSTIRHTDRSSSDHSALPTKSFPVELNVRATDITSSELCNQRPSRDSPTTTCTELDRGHPKTRLRIRSRLFFAVVSCRGLPGQADGYLPKGMPVQCASDAVRTGRDPHRKLRRSCFKSHQHDSAGFLQITRKNQLLKPCLLPTNMLLLRVLDINDTRGFGLMQTEQRKTTRILLWSRESYHIFLGSELAIWRRNSAW